MDYSLISVFCTKEWHEEHFRENGLKLQMEHPRQERLKLSWQVLSFTQIGTVMFSQIQPKGLQKSHVH